MRTTAVLSLLLVAASCGGRPQTDAPDARRFAVQMITDAAQADWDFQSTFVPHLCTDIKDGVLANPRAAAEWQSSREYGPLVEVLDIVESTYDWAGGGPQIDVKAKMQQSERPIVFRLWLKLEDGRPCLYGYNLFEEPPQR